MKIKEIFPGCYQFAVDIYGRIKKEKYKKLKPSQYPEALKKLYKKLIGYDLDLDNPKRWTEKIQYKKLFDNNPLYTELSDKYLVKKWVENKIGSKYVIETLDVVTSFDEINFDNLPEQFVIKANNATGKNIVVKEKNKLDINKVRKKISKWMKEDFGLESGFELQYLSIDKRIIIEKFISQIDGNLYDYKIHCFHGEPRFIQLIGDRDVAKHTGKQIILNFDWRDQGWCFDDYPKYEKLPPCPNNLDEIYKIAKDLSSEFDYVRVDLYNIEGKVLFGEMTFTPGSGFYRPERLWTIEKDSEIGELI